MHIAAYVRSNGILFLASHGLCPTCVAKLGEKKESSHSKHLRDKTMKRINEIRRDENVKSLTYMWECDFKAQCLQNREMMDFSYRFNPSKAPSTYESSEQIIEDILDDTLTGYVLATVSIKKKFRLRFDHYPPFFKRWRVFERSGVSLCLVPHFTRFAATFLC